MVSFNCFVSLVLNIPFFSCVGVTPLPSFICVNDSVPISGAKQCDFSNDCADKSDEANCAACQFEGESTGSDSCGWTDTSTGQYEWVLVQGNTEFRFLVEI